MPRQSLPSLGLTALLAAALWGCFRGDDGSGTEVENEIGVGRLYLKDGRPASDATVRIYRVDEVPAPLAVKKRAEAVLVTHTDEKGRYRVSDLARGEYNILGELDGAFSFQDSLALDPESSPPPDTLREPGAIRGVVAVQPNHDPRTVTVQLLGTNRFANVDANGGFGLDNLAAGTYSARLVTTLPEYTATFTTFQVITGTETALRDTLRLIYTGIPVVEGLQARYDTSSGVVQLSWTRAAYRQFDEYLIYRDSSSALSPSLQPVGRTRDTVFADTIFLEGPTALDRIPFSRTDPRDVGLEYRVRVKNKSAEIGASFGSLKVIAVSPTKVATTTSLFLRGVLDRTVTVGDKAAMVFTFHNPNRALAKVEWFEQEGDPPFRSLAVSGKSGTDSISYQAGSKEAVSNFIVKVTDQAGSITRDGITIQVVDDKPMVLPRMRENLVRVGDSVHLSGLGLDRGRIVKWEWDIGNTGRFTETAGPDTAILAPSKAYRDGDYFCALRATDEDGNTVRNVLGFSVSPWQVRKGMITHRRDFGAAVADGKLYVMGGIHTFSSEYFALDLVEVYDPVQDRWERRAPMKVPRLFLEAAAMDGKIYALGGGRGILNSSEFQVYPVVEEYDPGADAWKTAPPMGFARKNFSTAVRGGKIYIASHGSSSPTAPITAYDPITGQNSYPFPDFQVFPNWETFRLGAVQDGKMFHFGLGNSVPFILEPGRPTTTGNLNLSQAQPLVAQLGPEVLLVQLGVVAGENLSGPVGTRAMTYHLENGSRAPKSPLPEPRLGARAITLDGKVYVLGGYKKYAAGGVFFDTMEMWDPALDP